MFAIRPTLMVALLTCDTPGCDREVGSRAGLYTTDSEETVRTELQELATNIGWRITDAGAFCPDDKEQR